MTIVEVPTTGAARVCIQPPGWCLVGLNTLCCIAEIKKKVFSVFLDEFIAYLFWMIIILRRVAREEKL